MTTTSVVSDSAVGSPSMVVESSIRSPAVRASLTRTPKPWRRAAIGRDWSISDSIPPPERGPAPVAGRPAKDRSRVGLPTVTAP
ncbi:hypothetical protein GCM10027614_24150 [Micromonospora vulcania]